MNNKKTGKASNLISDFGVKRVAKTDIQKKPQQKPEMTAKNSGARVIHRNKINRDMTIQKSQKIAKFSKPATKITKPAQATKKADSTPPARHPLAQKADMVMDKKRQVHQPRAAKEIKEEAIAMAFAKLSAEENHSKMKQSKSLKIINTVGIIIGILLLVGIMYLAYLNLPALSTNIAGAQAGISASFPEYKPDGFKLAEPVSEDSGKVVIRFKSSASETSFTLTQTKSSWDSTAVKEQVAKDSGGHFITTEERGLTIFTYSGNAAWVNGGILYTINGDAELSSDQIRRIAASL